MAIARLTETVGAANSTTTPYDVNVAAPASTPNGVCVVVIQIGSAADQVTSVTYGTGAGAVPLTERRFVPITSEAGAIYLYWASGVIFPAGAQVVRLVKTAAAANHRLAVCPMVVAAGQQVSVDFDTQSVSTVSVTNPSWTHTTVAAPTECYFGIVSDLNAITGMAVAANWTALVAITDEGNQQRVYGRRTMNPAGNALPGMTAPAEGYAGASISFKEAPLTVAKTLADAGTAADSVTVTQPPTAVTLTDSGQASEQLQPTAAIALPDSGNAAETLRPAAVVAVPDQGLAADALRPAATVPLTDSGAAAEHPCHDGGPAGAPDCILDETNLVGDLTRLWDDPTAPDANWLTALDPTLATDLRVSFPTPATAPGSGGPTIFQAWVRKQGSGTDPDVTVELWEAGMFVKTLTTATVTSSSGQLVTATLTPADLAVPDGSQVELRLSGGGSEALWPATWPPTWGGGP